LSNSLIPWFGYFCNRVWRLYLSWPVLWFSYLYFLCSGRTGSYHCAQLLLVEIGYCKLFAWAGPWLVMLPISTSQVTRVTGMSHHTQSVCEISTFPFFGL
jgi:hypothetical protein